MARFAFEALGSELTEGQPDASANKANEKKSRTMKKVIATAGLGAAAITALVGAGTAQADTAYDNYRYLQGLNNNGIYVINTDVAISNGHTICAKLGNGYTAYDAQQWVFYNNPALAWRGAYNWVGVATQYYCPQYNYLVYASENY